MVLKLIVTKIDWQPRIHIYKEYYVIRARRYLPALCILPSVMVMAQNPGANDAQMQDMMQGMAQMAACFQNIDQDKFNALVEEGKAVEAEIKTLCEAGERDQAQARAVEHGLRFVNSEEFQQLKQCGSMAEQMLSQVRDYSVYTEDDTEETTSSHVCDEI